jgi:tRNA(Ile)-lysidine synthase
VLPTSDVSIVVAVSGGADSTALLLALDELIKASSLGLNMVVAHLDHGLRSTSRKDALWVKHLGNELGCDVVVGRANLKQDVSLKHKRENLEQAARKARYDFLLKTAVKKHADYVLTAHTLDDQAETILMRLLRGSASEGLSGTPAIRKLQTDSSILLVRPLIAWAHRQATEEYCRSRRIEFLHDEMNEDETFSRVRVRKQLLPLMKSFNNRVVEALNRTASLLNEDAEALADEANSLLEVAQVDPRNNETRAPSLSVSVLLRKPAAVRRRALREWILRSRGDLRRLEMVHLVAVEKLLEGNRGGRTVELPDGIRVTRKRGMLELSNKNGLKMNATTSRIRWG